MASHKPQLGEKTEYPTRYDPELLVSIPRSEGRANLPGKHTLHGYDLWTAYELSWLTPAGKPCVAVGEFEVDCGSAAIVESKSLKLYLNSLNQAAFATSDELAETLRRDLGAAFGGPVKVVLYDLESYAKRGFGTFEGICLDDLDVACTAYHPDSTLLHSDPAQQISETLYSHLLKSNCPVTGQPDWASLAVTYRGSAIDREGLLRYLVSFRDHQDFHEQCVERIFCDIMARCAPQELSVYARYTRRGGLDINPFRGTSPASPGAVRIARQ
ncbi:MAG: NADPH-dependent 7-cyano-7-deazaguanine reductase QueF [Porticoccaceae bacterium]